MNTNLNFTNVVEQTFYTFHCDKVLITYIIKKPADEKKKPDIHICVEPITDINQEIDAYLEAINTEDAVACETSMAIEDGSYKIVLTKEMFRKLSDKDVFDEIDLNVRETQSRQLHLRQDN